MPNTPLAGIPYADGTTPIADWDDVLQTALVAAEKKLVLSFTDATARNSAITSPVAGMMAYLTTPKQLTFYDGGGWVVLDEEPQTWSNPFTGITGGSLSFSGTTQRNGGFCDIEGRLAFGGTPSAISSLAITLPYAPAVVRKAQFSVMLTDTGTANYFGYSESSSTSSVGIQLLIQSGATYLASSGVTTTAPHAWGNTDTIEISGRYRMASRYS